MTRALQRRTVDADRVVARLQEAARLLERATTVQQVKVIADIAAAQKLFAQRQKLGDEVIGHAHALKIYALSKLADLAKHQPKSRGTRGNIGGRLSGGAPRPRPIVDFPSYADLGIDKTTAKVVRALQDLPESTREAIARRETTIAKTRRERRAVEVQRRVALPDAKYRVVYADPPWSYGDKADDGAIQAGGAERHYPSMSIADLCALPIVDRCDPDAVLFLWVTSPLLFDCAPVIKAWGFTYKASFVWDKVKHNMGHYNSVRHEFLLVCTRGSCTPDVVELFDSVQSIERTTHSTKPDAFRRIIDTLYPHGKRIELFARTRVDGWDVYGYESPEAAAV